jgi:histidine triad (HIT) family protein
MRCIFCRIVARETDSEILFQDEKTTAFLDIRPQAPTHVLVVPNPHISSLEELLSTDSSLLLRMFSVAQELADDAGVADKGYRLTINNGPDAGQLVDHLHLHLLGGKPMGPNDMALRWKDQMA